MDWKRFFDSLGLNGTHWQWRMMRLERRWENFKAGWGQRKQHVTYQHKYCRSCNRLLDRDEKVCPHCGAKAQSWRSQSIARAFGLIMPSACIGTPVLIAANIGVLVVQMIVFGGEMLINPGLQELVNSGALVPPLVSLEGEWWRLITYGYLHGGFLHIAFNMFALTQVGSMLENEIGTARFFTLYTVTLIGGGVADLVFRANQMTVIVGASGALFGLIGFGLSFAHFYGGPAGRQWRSFFLRWGIYGFLIGYAFDFDNIAHAGGFAAGLVMGFLIERERLLQDRLIPLWRAAAAACLLATLGSFGWMLWQHM